MFLGANGLCEIHEARPQGCRLYPAVWDEDVGRAELDRDYCPYSESFLLPKAIQDAAGRLAATLQQERQERLGRRP